MHELLGAEAGDGDRRGGLHQRLRVRVLRILEDLLRRPLLDDLAAVHHDDPLCTLGGQSQVVRDEQHGGAELTRHRADLVEDRLLHRDVQGAGRLVGDEQARFAGHPDRDQRALSHTARELVRVLLGALRSIRESRRLERLDDLLRHVLAVCEPVREQRLSDLRADLGDRVQIRHRVLRHEADIASADAAQLGLGGLRDLATVQADAATGDAPATGEQPDDRHRGGRLPRARLPHDRDRLALGDVEVDTLDGVDDAIHRVEVDREIADGQQRSRHALHLFVHQRALVLGSIDSRSASPKRVKPSAVTAMQMPGRNASHGAIESSACA